MPIIPPPTDEEIERLKAAFAASASHRVTILPPDSMQVLIRESAEAYGQAFVYQDPATGVEHVLDPQHVTIVKTAPADPTMPELDLDWHGDAYDQYIDATKHVVSFRRFGPRINLGVVPSGITMLTADEAEDLAANLYAAARAARKATT